MKPAVSPILFFLFISPLLLAASGPDFFNQYGKRILQTTGEQQNYTRSELQKQQSNLPSSPTSLISGSMLQSENADIPAAEFQAKTQTLYSIMGSGIGYNSLSSLDIDSDGVPEIICSATTTGFGSSNFWYILKKDTGSETWHTLWSSPVVQVPVSAIRVLDADNDGAKEILVAHEDGTIQLFDPATRTVKKEFKPVSSTIKTILLADADNDGADELLIGAEDETVLLKPGTFDVKTRLDFGASVVQVGQTQRKGQKELVFSSGLVYLIKDTVSSTVWNFGISGSLMEVSDLDGDSLQEIIIAQDWYQISVLDVDDRSTRFTLNAELNIDALTTADVNGDGRNEILYGDGQWGSIYCINPTNQAILWQIKNPEHGVAALAVLDANNDGRKDLIWTAGYSSTGSDYLYIYDVGKSRYLWTSEDVVGPFNAIATGDLDGDGKKEIVTVSFKSESSYESGILMVFDGQTNTRKWRSSGNFLTDTWKGVRTAEITDLDEDGKKEIVVATESVDKGVVWVVDGEKLIIKQSHIFDLPAFRSMCISDVDGDGKTEIVVVDELDSLHIINPATWAIKKTLAITSSYYTQVIRAADLNQDGVSEIILCSDYLSVIDGVTGAVWTSSINHFSSLDIYDWDGDGKPDILTGNDDGYIFAYDGVNHTLLAKYQPESDPIAGLRGIRFGNQNNIVYSTGSKLALMQENAAILRSQMLGESLGNKESLQFLNATSNATDVLLGSSIAVQRLHLERFILPIDSLVRSCDSTDSDTIQVPTNEAWTCTNIPDWITADLSFGASSTLVIHCNPNPSALKRTAYLKIETEKKLPFYLKIIQKGIPAILYTSTDTVRLGFLLKRTQTLQVTSNIPWSVRSYASWLSVRTGSGNLSNVITMEAQPNNSVQQREANIILSGEGISKVIRIVQSGSVPLLEVENKYLTVDYAEGSEVSIPVVSNLHWFAVCNQDWLTFSKLSGTSSGNVLVKATENPFVNERQAEIRFYANGVSDVVLTVTQLKGLPYLRIEPAKCVIDSTNNGTDFIIHSNVGWHISTNRDWISLSKDTGSMDAQIMVTAEPNLTSDVRNAVITIGAWRVGFEVLELTQEKYKFASSIKKNELLILSEKNSGKVSVRNLMANSMLYLYDSNGKKLQETEVKNATVDIDVSSLPQGVYWLRYQSEREEKFGRFIR